MTHPLLTRAHLEALLIARALFGPAIAEQVDWSRLSPAAERLLDAVVAAPAAARVAGLLAVTPSSDDPKADQFCVRLARHVDGLTLAEMRELLDGELVMHLNALPQLASSSSDRAA